MKIDPPMWMADDIQCMNVPVEYNNDNFLENGPTDQFRSANKLFVNKLFAIGYNTFKNPDFQNLISKEDGCATSGSLSLCAYNK